MSITRLTALLAAMATALAFASSTHAQLFKPFAFPPLESDFQFFAPGHIDTYGGGPKHKTGWFATYDRVYMNVQRPDVTFQGYSEAMGDFTWGNRFDLGFIDDDSKGWVATIWHIDGPNLENIVVTERLNRVADGSPFEEIVFPIRDNNLRLTGARDFLVTNSVNVADMTGFELNRTWLWKPLHHGGRLQPIAGVRYTRFIDFYQRQYYYRYDDDGILIPPDGLPPSIGTTPTAEELITNKAGVINDMLGGQLGMHWDKDYRQWNFSGDVKFFAMQNFQNWDQTQTKEVYLGADDDPPSHLYIEEDAIARHNAEFVFGMEVRLDAAYRITRDISLRCGFEFIDFGKGIGRGVDPLNESQEVVMFGATMGVTWNR